MKIKILGPVEHDGKRLEAGDTANLPDRVARELVAAGAAEPDGKQKAAASSADGVVQSDSEGGTQQDQASAGADGAQEGQQ
ncbi:hypothetical protein ASC94_09200 [Massilia sp. Root418]|uniref:DUF7210 family protein n=1 Tax=Massilia sp. Root418 TaxID=1736532 RepID=UPI0006F285B2|nr:hypothetical protein [Massilia sp. Root418]KQW96973.1 hypothetical protein ASC94_09200 [Massilia sp. Root418]